MSDSLDVITLRAPPPATGPGFVEAHVLPGRGMMLLQARLRRPSGEVIDAIVAPPLEAAAAEFGRPDDAFGNKAFMLGGAVLVPYANRIRGRAVEDAEEIELEIGGRTVRLPRNWGGQAPGAERYAMHGLLLEAAVPFTQSSADQVTGRLDVGDFGGRWPGRMTLDLAWRLHDGALCLSVTARNVGDEPLPIGIGFHPYLALPSGDRRQVRLTLPARLRAEVNDYDEVLPTGRLLPVTGTAYDFTAGAPLGELYLDDCFTDLVRTSGQVVVEVEDPAAELGYRIASASPQVKALQVFAPPDKPFVAIEPQFNLADPFGQVWPRDVDTGMAQLQPGRALTYDCRLSAFAVGNRTHG